MRYLFEILINEMHIMSYLVKELPHYDFHNFLKLYYQTHPGTIWIYYYGYSYNLILIEAILIKKTSLSVR